MFLNSVPAAPMRIRMLRADDVRRRLAEAAAAATGKSVSHFLELLGPVEPAARPLSDHETGWRLASYHGSLADNEAIERAVTRVQRTFPFMQSR